MSDPSGDTAPQSSAGQMLRAARERRGLHIAVLAASVKVPQRKLEALEADRYEELPDVTFARALAQTVCRYLKIDPAPVLARLPQPGGEQAQGLVHVSNGLASPYRDRPGHEQRGEKSWLHRPMFWATALVLLAAAVLALLPDRLWTRSEAPAPLQSSAPGLAAADSSVPVMPPSAQGSQAEGSDMQAPPRAGPASVPAPPVGPPVAQPPAAPVAAARGAVLRASAISWVEARDAAGRVLLSRTLQPDETVDLDGALPMRLTIGNARATQVLFQGRSIDLGPATGRDNVARLELK